LIRRHLWAIGQSLEKYASGQLLANRYLYRGDRILLDTMPGLPPDAPAEVYQTILPYLRLASYQLHTPQIYGAIYAGGEADIADEIILLEHVPIVEVGMASANLYDKISASSSEMSTQTFSTSVQLLPKLTDAWAKASAIRQLNWLWQLAQLWQPLSAELVASSIFTPELLRVEGAILRFLELRFDSQSSPTLGHLGQLWQSWAATAHPHLEPFLHALCQQMIQDQIQSVDQVLATLDKALNLMGRSQSYAIQIVSHTDQGPSRQRNEDACYPPSGTEQKYTIRDGQLLPSDASYLIVCDGIGGHQGGDVASHLAIEAVKQHMHQVPLAQVTPKQLQLELETSVCRANDFISENNDVQQRRERERMGTTLVMGLMLGPEIYLTHIGDSRAYWITQHGCHQITLDDDIASRELRLGYNTYRNALQHPSSGSLVQALGMGSSATLHPTVQRFFIEEDSIFLFCSDGLSDNDRIEEYWETIVLPVLMGKSSLAVAAQQLIEVANTQNGYDNVTVGLVYYQVLKQRSQPLPLPEALSPQSAKPHISADQATQLQSSHSSNDTTAPLPPTQLTTDSGTQSEHTHFIEPSAKPSIGMLLLGIAVLLGVGGGLAYLLFPSVGDRLSTLLTPSTPPSPETTLPSTSPSAAPNTLTSLQVGDLIQVSRSTVDDPDAPTDVLTLLPRPEETTFPASPEAGLTEEQTVPSPNEGSATISPSPSVSVRQGGTDIQTARALPAGSILQVLQVLSKQEGQGQMRWIRVKICVIPGYETTEIDSYSQLVQPNDVGWIQEARIAPIALPITSNQIDLGSCGEF
jgi:protein phosphatase